MFRPPQDVPTMTFDWGAIKWAITPDAVAGSACTFGEIVINPNAGHARHEHPESDEILYVIEGTGTQTIGDSGDFAVSAGDTLYIPKGTLHSTFNTGWTPLRLIGTYLPGGAENALRHAPDFAELPAGRNPSWSRADG